MKETLSVLHCRTEPPGLFRGRGEHPKQGTVKRRIMPEDVIINCSEVNSFGIELFRWEFLLC